MRRVGATIYAKFLSWKIAQGILDSIIKANREGKITIFACQKYSKKVPDRMNSLLLKRKEFKKDEVRKTWKSYIKFPRVLMVKKPQIKNKKFLTVILEMLLFKDCVCYIFASLFCMSKREHLRNKKNAFYFTSKALLVLEIINF